MLSPEFIEECRQKLLAAKARLTEELSLVPGHEEIGTRPEDNAMEEAADMPNFALAARLRQDLVRIEKALQKIQDGTYGLDDNGQQISERKLRILPYTDVADV